MSVSAALAARFSLMSRLMDVLGEDSFRGSAYARAARTVADAPVDLEALATGPDAKKQLTALDGIGPKIADKIIEFVSTGAIADLEALRTKVPPGLIPLMDLPGLGPKTVATLWRQGGVESLEDLKRILADKTIEDLPRMGERAARKIADAIAHIEQAAASGESRRLHLGLAIPIAERIVERLRAVPGVSRAAYAGSARRGRETVADIDILVATTDANGAKAASAAFRGQPEVREVLAAGDAKSSVRFSIKPDMGRWEEERKDTHESMSPPGPSIQVDLRVVEEGAWGAALMYFTGSKEHNVHLRERALKKNLTLNEYGLFPEDRGTDEPPQKRGVAPVCCATEEEIYSALDLAWVPPEVREDRGEIEAYSTGAGRKGGKRPAKPAPARSEPAAGPPALIEMGDIKAELHAHTTASDGSLSILALAAEARRRGYHTIAVTDHSKSSAIAGGLSPDRLRAHVLAIHAARAEIEGITILAGSEVDILADGTLDYDDELLSLLDIVVASPHAGLKQDGAAATARLLRAIEHPLVRVLGHPTGRMINKRPGLSPDMGAVIAAAKEHNVALEINAHWMRLDLRDTHARMAVEAGALIAIDCDTHDVDDLDNLRYGVATARRAWVTPERCINTWPAERLHAWLKRP